MMDIMMYLVSPFLFVNSISLWPALEYVGRGVCMSVDLDYILHRRK